MAKFLGSYIYPLAYFFFWLTLHLFILGYEMLFYSISVSAAYGFGHFLSARKGKVCLCSDTTALPLVLITAIIYIIVSWLLGHFPSPDLMIDSVKNIFACFPIAYLGSHALLFSLLFLFDKFTSKG